MDAASRRTHWQGSYTAKGEREVSWFQDSPQPSLDLIAQVASSPAAAIVDLGGGASRLADALLERGFQSITVVDLSEAALATAKARIGDAGERICWITADVTAWEPPQAYDVWHDRATFHFLTEEADRTAYLSRLTKSLKPGGHAVIATFAPDGPERCSGLPVVRYDADSLARTLGPAFVTVSTQRHTHRTPWDAPQQFQFSVFRRVAPRVT